MNRPFPITVYRGSIPQSRSQGAAPPNTNSRPLLLDLYSKQQKGKPIDLGRNQEFIDKFYWVSFLPRIAAATVSARYMARLMLEPEFREKQHHSESMVVPAFTTMMVFPGNLFLYVEDSNQKNFYRKMYPFPGHEGLRPYSNAVVAQPRLSLSKTKYMNPDTLIFLHDKLFETDYDVIIRIFDSLKLELGNPKIRVEGNTLLEVVESISARYKQTDTSENSVLRLQDALARALFLSFSTYWSISGEQFRRTRESLTEDNLPLGSFEGIEFNPWRRK